MGTFTFWTDCNIPVSKTTRFPAANMRGIIGLELPHGSFLKRTESFILGTSDGNIFAFATDYDDMGSYVDNGITAITAQWLTPEFYGKDFYKNKNFTKIAVLLASAVATGCRIWALYEGIKELLRDYDNTARYFSYEGLSYSKFTYKTDTTPRDMMEKIKIKKVKKVQFLFENDIIRESFGLYGATAEFTEVE